MQGTWRDMQVESIVLEDCDSPSLCQVFSLAPWNYPLECDTYATPWRLWLTSGAICAWDPLDFAGVIRGGVVAPE